MLHRGLTREKAAEVARLGRATVHRYVAPFPEGGLDGLRRWDVQGPKSDLAFHYTALREDFTRRASPGPGLLHVIASSG